MAAQADLIAGQRIDHRRKAPPPPFVTAVPRGPCGEFGAIKVGICNRGMKIEFRHAEAGLLPFPILRQ